MGQINNVNRILSDDFPEDSQETIERLAEILNPFMEQVANTLNNNVDFSNLAQKVVTLTLTVDINGIPVNVLKFNSTINRAQGCNVINARNLTDSSIFPSSAVQVFFSMDQSGSYKVNKVTGLQANNKYEIKLVMIA